MNLKLKGNDESLRKLLPFQFSLDPLYVNEKPCLNEESLTSLYQFLSSFFFFFLTEKEHASGLKPAAAKASIQTLKTLFAKYRS